MADEADEIAKKIKETRVRVASATTQKDPLDVRLQYVAGEKEPDFYLTTYPDVITMEPGDTKTANITLFSLNGFSQEVDIGCSNGYYVYPILPKAGTKRIRPIPNGKRTFGIQIVAKANAIGLDTLEVIGISTNGIMKSTIIKVFIKPTSTSQPQPTPTPKPTPTSATDQSSHLEIEKSYLRKLIHAISDDKFREDLIQSSEEIIGACDRGDIPIVEARKKLEELANLAKRYIYDPVSRQLIIEGRYLASTGVGKAGKYAWNQKHWVRAPFFGKIQEGPALRVERMDPKIRSIINKGRIELRKEAKEKYKEEVEGFKDYADKLKKNIKDAKDEYDKVTDAINKFLEGMEDISLLGSATKLPGAGSITDIASSLRTTGGGAESSKGIILAKKLEIAYDKVKAAIELEEKINQTGAVEDAFYNKMKELLLKKADEIAQKYERMLDMKQRSV